MKKIFMVAAVAIVALGIVSALQRSWGTSSDSISSVAGASVANQKAVVYKSPTCGCCNSYVSYLKRQGFDVETVNTNDTSSIKAQYGIPAGYESCHTTVIGDYAIEGHVPVQSIAKLLQERPAVAGIALPGMPEGSPGMGGVKRGAFDVLSFTNAGDVGAFDRP